MKTLKVMLSLVLLIAVCGCQKIDSKTNNAVEKVTVFLTIIDETAGTELFCGEISAEGSDLTLEDLLQANAETLQLVSEKGLYGMQIIGLMGIETTDWNAGPWWMYTSENNASCLKAGYCDAAAKLKAADGDEFTFTFSKGY